MAERVACHFVGMTLINNPFELTLILFVETGVDEFEHEMTDVVTQTCSNVGTADFDRTKLQRPSIYRLKLCLAEYTRTLPGFVGPGWRPPTHLIVAFTAIVIIIERHFETKRFAWLETDRR